MNCTTQALLQASACYRCIPKPVMRASMISLLCEWANHITPTDQLIWEPQTEVMKWTDSGGTHSGDLATFQSTADIPTVTSFDCNHKPITSITGLSSIPALQIFAGSDVWTVTSLDFTGCNNIQSIGLDLGGTLTSLIVNNLPSLTTLLCPLNQLVGLDVSGDSSLTTLDCSFNAPMTSLTLTGCTSLSYLDCNSCNITGTLDASGLSSLATLNCSSNASLTTLTLTGCTALTTLNCSGCAITSVGFVLPAAPSSLTSVQCQNNNLTSLNFSGYNSITDLDCSSNPITALTVSGMASIDLIYCFNTSITSLNLTGNPLMETVDCSGNSSLASLIMGASTVYNYVDASGCALPDTPNGVNECLVALVATIPGPTGSVDLSGGTNSAPTVGPPDGIAAAATLNLNAWLVVTN